MYLNLRLKFMLVIYFKFSETFLSNNNLKLLKNQFTFLSFDRLFFN